jgi:hypothetical protein
MILTERASNIVMITKLREKGRAKCEAYLPSGPGQPMMIEDIAVEVVGVTERPGYVIRDVKVKVSVRTMYAPRHKRCPIFLLFHMSTTDSFRDEEYTKKCRSVPITISMNLSRNLKLWNTCMVRDSNVKRARM